jgi:uncharacterized oxidoreductase
MDFKGKDVLITGGSEGIGRGLAARILAAGGQVLVTGRHPDKLRTAAAGLPGLRTYVNDISVATEREKLAAHLAETMPGLTVVINNAGFQRRVALAADRAPWQESQAEIDTLFSGPVHLNHLLIPLLIQEGKSGLIVNVTSGGAYIPQVFAPVYSASKAALHSYTMTLRHSLAATQCRVVELIPPAVRTTLAGPGSEHGASLEEFCDTVFEGLVKGGGDVVGFGVTANLQVDISGQSLEAIFADRAAMNVVERYGVSD